MPFKMFDMWLERTNERDVMNENNSELSYQRRAIKFRLIVKFINNMHCFLKWVGTGGKNQCTSTH